MTICSKESNKLVTTYELILDHEAIIQMMIDQGMTFLEDDSELRPTMDVLVRDFDCGTIMEKKRAITPTDRLVFRFKLTADTISTTPLSCELTCDQPEDGCISGIAKLKSKGYVIAKASCGD
jgi:hypothetical protein